MKPQWLIFFLFVASCLSAQPNGTPKTDGITFNVQTIDYPGAGFSRAVGINNSGTISGTFRINPPQRPYRLKNGQYETVVGIPPGFAQGWGINDRGDTVGIHQSDDDIQHGYLLTADGVFTDLVFPGALETDPIAVNNSGTVVGYFSLDEDSFHCFIYANGQFQQFDVPGARDTICQGINARGDISGNWDTDINTLGHGFISSNGQIVPFDHPSAAANSTTITGINDRGDFIGLYVDTDGTGHRFLRLANSLLQEIPFPATATSATPWSINNARQIVGNYLVGTERHAFLLTPAGSGKPF